MLNPVRRGAIFALSVCLLAAAQAPALPARVAGDVQLSYTLLDVHGVSNGRPASDARGCRGRIGR